MVTSNGTPRVSPTVIQIAPRPPSLPLTDQPPSTWRAQFHTAATTMREAEGGREGGSGGTVPSGGRRRRGARAVRSGRRRSQSARFRLVTRYGLVLSPLMSLSPAAWLSAPSGQARPHRIQSLPWRISGLGPGPARNHT